MLAGIVILAAAVLAMSAGWAWDHHKQQLRRREMESVLADMVSGNLNRHLVVRESDAWAEVCYGINALSAACQAKQRQMRALESANKQLLTSLTHDVRTPLTSLRGYLEALDSAALSAEERRADVQIVQRKAQELQRYVEQLFLWFKLANGEERCQPERGDWAEAIRRIAVKWLPRWEDAGWQYELALPEEAVWVRFDPVACQRMLDNILSNSLTHSGGSLVTLSLQTQAEEAVLCAADNGQGVAEEDLPHLFERLYTGDASRRQGQGSGLGLAIVRSLAEAQGGRVWAESAPGAGLRVFVALPLACQ